MDSLTHIALGACIGDAMLGRQIGKRAMLLGAIAASIPDIDFIAGFWTSTSGDLLAHRGFTHSFLFAIIMSVLFALVSEKIHRPHNISARKWMFFFGLQIFLHLFLDAFNVYGTGWFEPFSHYRVSFNAIFVADPFFSIWGGIAFVALLVLKRNSPKRMGWTRFALVLSSMYLFYCVLNKVRTDDNVKDLMAQQHIAYKRYFTTPAPFNNWLWYVVAETDSGYYTGYRSVFDDGNPLDLHYFPRNDFLLTSVHDHEDLHRLRRFSKGYYTAERWNDTLVFNDLRFGQIIGWQHPDAHFVFHYYLQHEEGNDLVVQRGRFTNWNWDVIKQMVRRIRGKRL